MKHVRTTAIITKSSNAYFMRGFSRDGNDSILWKYNCNAMKIDLHRVIALGRFLNNVGHTTGVVAANC